MDDGFCREIALAEPLAGTGQDAVSRWVLVEDGCRWGAKVPAESELPPAVRDWMAALDAQPGTRTQLIRRPGRGRGDSRQVFVVDAGVRADGRRLVELEVTLAELPDLDPDELLAEAPETEALAALWLVCTHGTRDRCCAKWGLGLWAALSALAPDRVWQCSHLGGHRFAPTALCLPSGLLWGRIELDEVAALAASLDAGRLTHVERLRGRCAHPRVVQAAEGLVRLRDGILEDAALRLLAATPVSATHTRIRFGLDLGGGQVEEIEIVIEQARPGLAVAASCGDTIEPRPHYREATRSSVLSP